MTACLRPPFFSDAAGLLVHGKLFRVLVAVMNCHGITTEQLGDILHAIVAQLLGLDRLLTPAILLRQ